MAWTGSDNKLVLHKRTSWSCFNDPILSFVLFLFLEIVMKKNFYLDFGRKSQNKLIFVFHKSFIQVKKKKNHFWK